MSRQLVDWPVKRVPLDLVFTSALPMIVVLAEFFFLFWGGGAGVALRRWLLSLQTQPTNLGKCNDYLKGLEGIGVGFMVGDGI